MGAHIFIRRVYLLSAIVFLVFVFGCGRSKKEVFYTTGDWFADTLGYHRAELKVSTNADAVYLNIEWRRRDSNPENKLVIITDGAHGNVVDNIYPLEINREYGEFVFQPLSGKGTYFLYYLPGRQEGRTNYPKVNYPKAEYKTDNAWISLHKLTDSTKIKSFPEAEVVSFQSTDQFNSFYPMEIIATRKEVQNMVSSYPENSYLLFPETRFNSIRMIKYLPQKWIIDGPANEVTGEPMRGEYFTFQIGLFNIGNDIEDIWVTFSDITDKKGNVIIGSDKISSFNTSGRGWDGKLFNKQVKVAKEEIQPLWCGMMIPEDIENSQLKGSVTITPDRRESQTIPINLKIKKEIIADHGDNEPWRMTRLRWLDSDLGFDYSVVSPFTNVELRDNILKILGRKVTIGNSGLPASYRTYFNGNNTRINSTGEEVLAAPLTFNIFSTDGNRLYFSYDEVEYNEAGPGAYSWEVNSENRLLSLNTTGIIELDGFANIRIAITAKESTDLTNFQLNIPVRKKFAKYFMGLGYRGGKRPYSVRWKWDRMKHQEGAWIGNVNGGLQFSLRGDSYERPLNTNFYREKPLIMPVGWYNEGKGGIRLNTLENSVIIECYSGQIHLEKGEEIVFITNLLLTPFKTINTDSQWNTRFYHRYKNLDTILAYGANTINVHHATRINPWINYPFLEQDKMKAYIDSAHSLGMKVKIYNTIRELSNRAPEIFAIRSLGHEIFNEGNGDGFNWLQEHLGDDYMAAWFVPSLKDAAIINSGMSRWHNYYIEGIQWLTQKMEIDGLYLDDVAFDRTTMKRLRKVLDNNRDEALIDLHSANQYNERDGFTNSANLYMEHFPYINRLWFGEYFDRDLPPDFWLVEMSGIPFGLMGEMLQDGGNQYRGLLYGMTSRAPWSGDPGNIWDLWDHFKITGTKMHGYWSEECEVSTSYTSIPATVYRGKDRMMIVIASWNSEPRNVWLRVNWEDIGLERIETQFRAPAIENFQEEHIYNTWETIPVEPGKGIVLFLENRNK